MVTVKRSEFKRQILPDEITEVSESLGTYSQEPTSPAAIDRQACGDMGRGEYRYFNPAMTGEETGNPESPEQDYQRAEAYSRGDWQYVGVRATVTLAVAYGTAKVLIPISSPGVWGIESDSGDDYLASVFQEECSILADLLRELGVTVQGDQPSPESQPPGLAAAVNACLPDLEHYAATHGPGPDKRLAALKRALAAK